jgi:hypothetical protein
MLSTSSCFFLGSLVLRKQPVYYAGVQVLSQRIPPQVTARRAWDADVGAWSSLAADDGFNAFIQGYAPLAGMLAQLCKNDPLAIERALELLEGTLGQSTEWYQMKELSVLKVGSLPTIAALFLAGVVLQVVLAAVNKSAMWALYCGEVDREYAKTRRCKVGSWLSERYVIDLALDLASMVLFAWATYECFVALTTV